MKNSEKLCQRNPNPSLNNNTINLYMNFNQIFKPDSFLISRL
jgi:hypothetical protein